MGLLLFGMKVMMLMPRNRNEWVRVMPVDEKYAFRDVLVMVFRDG
jgi:hypothetical protein